MKNSLITFSIALLLSYTAFSQSTTITPGSILPNMTTAQRTAVVSPPNGMLVFDNTTQSYWFRQSGVWAELPKAGSTSNYWELNGANGNEIKNTNSGGFWSENPTTVIGTSGITKTAPMQGNGTRLMWIPSMSAFRAGSVTGGSKVWDKDSIGVHSVSFGQNTMASGAYAAAMGLNTVASSTAAFAMGVEAVASRPYSVALGFGSRASGFYSIAMGKFANASDFDAIALGPNSKASAQSAIAIGSGVSASGLQAVALGTGTKSTGRYSTTLGYETTAFGISATAMGDNTKASGYYSTSMGRGTHMIAYGGTAIGLYNDLTNPPILTTPFPQDRIFEIGNGQDDSNRSNAFTVLRNGNVGTYNVVDPQANLHLNYTQTLDWDAHLRLQYSSTQYGNIVYDFDGLKFRAWGAADDFYFRNSANTTVARINDTGNMTISGTLTQNSDKRLKKEIVGLNNSSNKINQLSGYNYRWIAEDKEQGLQTGLIAQEVQKLFPELVSEDEDGYLSVNYIGLIPHLIEANKEKDDLIKNQAALLQNQGALLEKLTNRLTILEAKFTSTTIESE